jgi:coenzyme Q-binding protein COQ10
VPNHTETRFVDLSADQVFDLVADVERYPEFLPFWRSAAVTDRTHEGYETEQTLAVGLWVQRFRTRTTLDRPRRIVVRSNDRLFRGFDIRWDFSPSADGVCRVDLSLECEVAFPFFQPILDLMMIPTAAAMVAAFENRARALAAS